MDVVLVVTLNGAQEGGPWMERGSGGHPGGP